ncbi:MAG: hypothetical protein O3B00_04695 [archaeon]|nr:hypothetical protein [archaeon]MDA1130780.1 hypothetical protein [archaeon]
MDEETVEITEQEILDMEEQETIVWKGYLACVGEDSCVVQSPWYLRDDCVFGADSDYTTLAIAAIQLLQSKGTQINSINALNDVEGSIMFMATGVEVMQTSNDDSAQLSAEWDLCIGDDARVVVCKTDCEVELWEPEGGLDVDEEFHHEMTSAWEKECQPEHVSQGAYVSQQQYQEGAAARLKLMSQKVDGELIWPPRQMDGKGNTMPQASTPLHGVATIESWTKLAAAGAPSEFSIRAPLLGGISTVFVRFEQGPRGVFLLVDDEENDPKIGDKVQFAIRMIYAQEGYIRYGLKCQIIRD